jgi:hypothetical protein
MRKLDRSTNGEQDLPKLESVDDEEEEEVDMRNLETYFRTDPHMGSRTYHCSKVKTMKRKRRWK